MPLEQVQKITEQVFEDVGSRAFQYGPTEGHAKLRKWLAEYHEVDVSTVMITTGSQQALDLISKIFIDPGSRILVENPTYVGALQSFDLFRADIDILNEDLSVGDLGDVRFIYVEPSFQNPTGRCWTMEQRKKFINNTGNVVIVEDDPYGDLYFGKTAPMPLRKLAPDRVIYLGSLSKIFNPGIRMSYVIAHESIIERMRIVKQSADMASSTFLQEIVLGCLESGLLDRHLPKLRKVYRQRRDWLCSALEKHLPESCQWNCPEGGLFVWIKLPKGMDSIAVHRRALESGLNFIPGNGFYVIDPDPLTLRLCYARITEPEADLAAQKLSRIVRSG
jgi:2-aminoadipate transaminase